MFRRNCEDSRSHGGRPTGAANVTSRRPTADGRRGSERERRKLNSPEMQLACNEGHQDMALRRQDGQAGRRSIRRTSMSDLTCVRCAAAGTRTHIHYVINPAPIAKSW